VLANDCGAQVFDTSPPRVAVVGSSGCGTLTDAHTARLAEATAAAASADPEEEDEDTPQEALRIVRSALARDFIAQAGAICRSSSGAYLEAINKLQRLDSYDPFLHREWGLILQARGGRDAEAAQHLAVAVTLFEQAAASTAAGRDVEGPQMAPAVRDAGAAAMWKRELAASRALLPPEARAQLDASRYRGEL
jgi:hypothetical protein